MNRYKIYGCLIWLVFALSSCSKDFLVAKQDFTGVNEQVFESPQMATAYVDYIYGLIQPGGGNGTSLYWELSGGNMFTQTTEELAGQTDLNRVWPQIAINQNHALKYFGKPMSTKVENTSWTRLKQINIFIREIDQHGMQESDWKPLKGQMHFWRAWQYFDLVKLYGGVPLVLEPQDPISGNADDNSIPRSSTTECIDQICADLDSAISLLPGIWTDGNWGRITSGAAAALKGRVLLNWASPLFNRTDDVSRWQRAYDANVAAKALLEQNGFGLYEAGNEPGEAWGKMWFEQRGNPEAVLISGYNTVTSDQTKKNNGWEQSARSKEIGGGGSISPTKQMVDAFPMMDGKKPGESAYPYDPNKFYKNRDPRFYKTFVYNGSPWPYKDDPKFIQWTYKWYKSGTTPDPSTKAPDLTTEKKGANSTGIYLSKATNPQASNSTGNFSISGMDVMQIRFAEVVLNLAECAVGIGKLSEGLEGIKEIRERAGIEIGDGTYGLGNISDRDQLFRAILDERKVEFAYEGLRFWDLRRWMLFDETSPYAIRLGLKDSALNGKRRTGYYIIATNSDGTYYQDNADPFHVTSATTPAGLFERAADTADHPGFASYGDYLDNLYDNYFKVVENDRVDPTGQSPEWVFTWYDEYYFSGLNRDVLSTSPYLEQTKGWPDINGAPGTFDPLK